jgi:hypothetical protein
MAYQSGGEVIMADAYCAGWYKIFISFLLLCLIAGCTKQVQETASLVAKPFALRLTDPQKDFVMTALPAYEVKGEVRGGHAPYKISCGEHVIVLNQEGPFVFQAQLKLGDNLIALTAKDAGNAVASRDVTIHRAVPVTKLVIVARKAEYEDNDKIIFDLRKQELRNLDAIVKKGRTVVVAGKINTGAKPEYLGEIVAIAKTGATRVKVQFRTPHPNISISIYKEFVLTEQ